jgi:hypothetical protein
MEFRVVTLFHLSDFAAQVFMSGEHDGDVDLHGAITMENAGEHGHAMFCEGVRTIAAATVNCQTASLGFS